MSTEPPVSTVRARHDEIADLALDLLSFDTQNPPGKTRTLVDWLEEYFEALELDTRRIVSDPAKPNLLVTVPGDSELTVLYLGHVDTVPFETGKWSYDPLGERDRERIYGRGATDMKGPTAAMLETIRSFVETDTTPPVTLLLALVSDEEVAGEAGLPTLLDSFEESDTVEGIDACVIGETTCQYGNHSVTVADRGSIWLTLSASGTAAHGSRPVLGDNAIDRLYRAVETIRERFGQRHLDIPTAVDPIIDESVTYYAPVMEEKTVRELFERPSINLGTLEGGESINSVPTTARARVDIRLSPGVQTPELLGDLRDCVAACEAVELTDVSWSIGTYEDPGSPFVETLVDIAADVTGDRIHRRSATGGGDAKTLRNLGVPTVEFALGTDTVHADDEYTTVGALAKNAEIYARFPYAFRERLHSP